jgi:hypothetical protein
LVSALTILEIQSNKAHRLRITDYIHDKSNTPFFFKSGGKNELQNLQETIWASINLHIQSQADTDSDHFSLRLI